MDEELDMMEEEPYPFKGLTWNQRVTMDQVRDIKGDRWFYETKEQRQKRETMEGCVGCVIMLGIVGVLLVTLVVLKILGWA